MFNFIKVAIVRAFIQKEIATLESAFENVSAKVQSVDSKVVADVELEVAKAKAIFAKYKADAVSEIAKVEAEIKAAEAAVVAYFKK
jgi:hypothetical protein